MGRILVFLKYHEFIKSKGIDNKEFYNIIKI